MKPSPTDIHLCSSTCSSWTSSELFSDPSWSCMFLYCLSSSIIQVFRPLRSLLIPRLFQYWSNSHSDRLGCASSSSSPEGSLLAIVIFFGIFVYVLFLIINGLFSWLQACVLLQKGEANGFQNPRLRPRWPCCWWLFVLCPLIVLYRGLRIVCGCCKFMFSWWRIRYRPTRVFKVGRNRVKCS